MNASNNHQPRLPAPQVVDLNLHGIVRIRLVEPAAGTAAALTQQLAPILLPPDNCPPDLTIRFQEEIVPLYLKYVGLNTAAFTDQNFYLLDKLTGQVTAQIPFETLGSQCEILCCRSAGKVPLLFHIINCAFLRKNYVPLHASAFIYQGVGIMVMGWPKGGKTGAMLSFMNRGAQYIGDEWVLVSSDGHKMFGIPLPVSISEWQFNHIPQMMPKISVQQQLLFKSIHLLESMHSALERQKKLKKSYFSKLLKKTLPVSRRQLKISKSPQIIFRNQIGGREARLDKLFWIISHSQSDICINPCDSLEIVERMIQANLYEMRDFFELYQAYKFAFPHQKNEFLERFPDLQRLLLNQAFAGKEAYQILHPYAGSLARLFDAIVQFCNKTKVSAI